MGFSPGHGLVATFTYAGPQWGQICFTAISSNYACHRGLHCSSFSVPAHAVGVRLSKCSMAGVRGKDPSLLHCTKSALACGAMGCKHWARLTPLCLVDRRFGPFLYWVRGGHSGQGSSAGGHLLLLAPLGHAFPLLVFGPKGGGGGIEKNSWYRRSFFFRGVPLEGWGGG